MAYSPTRPSRHGRVTKGHQQAQRATASVRGERPRSLGARERAARKAAPRKCNGFLLAMTSKPTDLWGTETEGLNPAHVTQHPHPGGQTGVAHDENWLDFGARVTRAAQANVRSERVLAGSKPLPRVHEQRIRPSDRRGTASRLHGSCSARGRGPRPPPPRHRARAGAVWRRMRQSACKYYSVILSTMVEAIERGVTLSNLAFLFCVY